MSDEHQTAEAYAAIINAGAASARQGGHRTDNPYDPDTKDWMIWRDGFEQQVAWSELGRGDYHADASDALIPRG